ncbi:MAG: sigma-70 family RNA polymerase sigma factor [Solirubrobacterales bacterium]|nr:sigma-70 family RNA polymerase sigma factor [Solirubrobacterales bacterium]
MALDQGFEGLLAAARTGAAWAWEELYRELSPGVLGYLRARGAHEPEDVLGEVFLQVVRDLPRFAGDERELRSWVFTIAHHRLLDDARSRRRRPVEPAGAEVGADMAGPSADEQALEALTTQRVRQVLARLAGDQQAVLLLRILGDLTVEEVARVLGKHVGAVKALQRRGLAAARKELESEGVAL